MAADRIFRRRPPRFEPIEAEQAYRVLAEVVEAYVDPFDRAQGGDEVLRRPMARFIDASYENQSRRLDTLIGRLKATTRIDQRLVVLAERCRVKMTEVHDILTRSSHHTVRWLRQDGPGNFLIGVAQAFRQGPDPTKVWRLLQSQGLMCVVALAVGAPLAAGLLRSSHTDNS